MPKVLIIRFSSIGDIVLTTPVIRCLKNGPGEPEIHYLTKKHYTPLLSSNPYIDRIWHYDHNFGKLLPELRKERFDFIIDLHRNWRSARVKLALGRPSQSFPKLNLQKWLMVNFKFNLLPDVHIVDRYFRAVESLGVVNDGEGLDYFIPQGEEAGIGTFPLWLREGFTAVVIGGKHMTKIFPAAKVAEVCRKLERPVILLGGKEDRERGEEIIRMTGGSIYNGCGEFGLNQAASIIRQADSVLTNDTGMMHIAAAFSKKIVSVWGNTIPAFGMYPYLPSDAAHSSLIAEVTSLSCRPCSKLGFRECPRKHFRCMNDMDTDEIVRHL